MSYPKTDSLYNRDFNPIQSLIWIVHQFPLDFLAAGVLIRGAIVKGKIYNYQNRLYGEGLAYASFVEKEAKIPIIAIPDDLLREYPLSAHDKCWVEPCPHFPGHHYIDCFFMLAEKGKVDEARRQRALSGFKTFSEVIADHLSDTALSNDIRLKWEGMKEIFNASLLKIFTAFPQCYTRNEIMECYLSK